MAESGNYLQDLKEDLKKYNSNLRQMTDEQKIQYKAPLEKLRHKIVGGAERLFEEWVSGGRRYIEQDGDFMEHVKAATHYWQRAIEAGFRKDAVEFYMQTEDLDLFLTAALPLHYQVWYEAYGKYYWLRKIEKKGEAPYQYYNPLLEMWWDDEKSQWCTPKEVDGKMEWSWPVTIMIPPTAELMEKQYKDDLRFLYEDEDGEWRKKLPFLFQDKYKTIFPHIFPREDDGQMTFDLNGENIQNKESDRWI